MTLSDEEEQKRKLWRVRILSTTWLSYAGFYFCRKNFAIAKSSILTSLEIDKSDSWGSESGSLESLVFKNPSVIWGSTKPSNDLK